MSSALPYPEDADVQAPVVVSSSAETALPAAAAEDDKVDERHHRRPGYGYNQQQAGYGYNNYGGNDYIITSRFLSNY